MDISRALFAAMLGLALSSNANSQVYESKDAEGNPVFSDKPSENAKVIDVPPTNSADSVADIPRPAPKATAPAAGSRTGDNAAPRAQREAGENDDDYIYYGGGAVNNEEAQQRREEFQERREEGAGKPGREPPVQVQPHRPVTRPAGGGGGRR